MAKASEAPEGARTLKEVPQNSADSKPSFRDLRAGETQAFEINHGWHFLTAPEGVTAAQQLDLHPTFWNMIAAQDFRSPGVHKYDSLTIEAHDGSWVADFRALRASNGLLVAKLQHVDVLPAEFADGNAKPIPKGWRLRTARSSEYGGAEGWIAEEKELRDGQHHLKRVDAGGMPFATEQAAYEALVNDPRFRAAHVVHYYS